MNKVVHVKINKREIATKIVTFCWDHQQEEINNARLIKYLELERVKPTAAKGILEWVMPLAVQIFAKEHEGYSLHRPGRHLARVVSDPDTEYAIKCMTTRVRCVDTKTKRIRAELEHLRFTTDPSQMALLAQATSLAEMAEFAISKMEPHIKQFTTV